MKNHRAPEEGGKLELDLIVVDFLGTKPPEEKNRGDDITQLCLSESLKKKMGARKGRQKMGGNKKDKFLAERKEDLFFFWLMNKREAPTWK
ncbi:hypothetical protein B9Z55_023951 [Caenorhabditis nigoni]|uniref:Uncharacterized protein n=1 Tax=Caenorhabditis nigoni TaxID=1611254 RepID=A0A2G5SS53_9PELO|nr:hypothetical protein B9Z55_023951 [Caenorhabditis nigoni]